MAVIAELRRLRQRQQRIVGAGAVPQHLMADHLGGDGRAGGGSCGRRGDDELGGRDGRHGRVSSRDAWGAIARVTSDYIETEVQPRCVANLTTR